MYYVSSSRPTHKLAGAPEPKLIRGGLRTSAVSLRDLSGTINDTMSFFQKGPLSCVLAVVAQDFLSADRKFLGQTLGTLTAMNSVFQEKPQHPPPSYTGLADRRFFKPMLIPIFASGKILISKVSSILYVYLRYGLNVVITYLCQRWRAEYLAFEQTLFQTSEH